MKTVKEFDVLIVYSDAIARSASRNNATPFSTKNRKNYNVAYSYFMEVCASYGLSVALTSSGDIKKAGVCRAFWTWKGKKWHKSKQSASSLLIFDKLSPVSRLRKMQRDLLFSSSDVKSYSDTFLFELFFDKQLTHDTLVPFSLPTISLQSASIPSISKGITSLRTLASKHEATLDFGMTIILKDRFGAGGHNIFKIESDHTRKIRTIMIANPKISFILQPFIEFGNGYSYKNYKRAADIRIIFEGQKIVQTYIRMAKKDDFRCNEHQGGTLIYTSQKDIPQSVIRDAKKIAEILGKKYALYALDFIVSDNGNTFLLEGNNGPGLDWNLSLKTNEQKSKKLIRIIVKELHARSEMQKTAFTKNVIVGKIGRPNRFLEN